ncbi:hypothetical protein ES705_37188 [subsurface metagenome]
MPAYCVDLTFDIIEGAVCMLVFSFVDKKSYGDGKLFDAACMVSQCHGISLKRLARTQWDVKYESERAQPRSKKMCGVKRTVAGTYLFPAFRRLGVGPATGKNEDNKETNSGRRDAGGFLKNLQRFAGHCYATERSSLNVDSVTRHKKAVFSLG